MKLSSKHINQLYKFTRQHYVEWYDLQTELVDHLANDIENIWQENPELSFTEARNQSFKKFGIFGFSDVIQEKHNALNKRYWKMVWHIFKNYFELPKIILSFLLIGITYMLFNQIHAKSALVIIYLTIFYSIIFRYLYLNHKKNKALFKKTDKKWLFNSINQNLGGAVSFAYIPFYSFSLFIDKQIWSQSNIIFTSVFIVISGLLAFILIKIIPPKMEEQMAKQFPEYKLYRKAK